VLLLLHAHDSHDPRLQLLADAVERMPVVPSSKPGILGRIANNLQNLYVRLTHSPYFVGIIIGCIIVYVLLFIGVVAFGIVNMGAVGELAVNLIVLGILNYLIRNSQREVRHARRERTTVNSG